MSEDIKGTKVNKTDELTVVFGRGNNNEELVRQVLLERKVWK